jgi:hypothetical protein
MPRFSTDLRPDHLNASILALCEQTTRLAVECAAEAAWADRDGRMGAVAHQVARLAVGAGVAVGEIAWLAADLGDDLAVVSRVAMTELQRALLDVADAIVEIDFAGAPVEVRAAAAALRRSGLRLQDLTLAGV